jgi:hypothetical protein
MEHFPFRWHDSQKIVVRAVVFKRTTCQESRKVEEHRIEAEKPRFLALIQGVLRPARSKVRFRGPETQRAGDLPFFGRVRHIFGISGELKGEFWITQLV